MKITVELEATAEIEIDLTEKDIFDVMQDYNGDFREWAKDNYNKYTDFNDFEIDFYDCGFDTDEAKKLILKSKDILGIDENGNIDKTIAHRTTLKKLQCDIPTIEEEIEEVFIDIDLVSKAVNFTDFNNPRIELNYIYLNGNTISATDTKKIIHIKNHKYSFDGVLLPPSFIEPIQNGAKLFISNDNRIYMKSENKWFQANNESDFYHRKIIFLDIDKILLNEDGYKTKIHFPFIKFLSNSVTTRVKDKIKINIFDETCYIKESFYNEIIDMHKSFYDVYMLENTPIHFIGENIEVVTMTVPFGEI